MKSQRALSFLLILSSLLIQCSQEKSDEDKMKSNYAKNSGRLLRDYAYARMFFGRYFMGDPLCGGDPIGTGLGLNKDIPTPISLEVGKTYQFEGNPNLVYSANSNQRNFNIFKVEYGFSDIAIRLTLNEKCVQPSYGISFSFAICSGYQYSYSIDTNQWNCKKNSIKSGLIEKDEYEECEFKADLNKSFLIILNSNNCKYKFELNKIGV